MTDPPRRGKVTSIRNGNDETETPMDHSQELSASFRARLRESLRGSLGSADLSEVSVHDLIEDLVDSAAEMAQEIYG